MQLHQSSTLSKTVFKDPKKLSINNKLPSVYIANEHEPPLRKPNLFLQQKGSRLLTPGDDEVMMKQGGTTFNSPTALPPILNKKQFYKSGGAIPLFTIQTDGSGGDSS